MTEPIIRVENIIFSYESKIILKDVSVCLPPKRICFVMGNNGSGKTTLLKNIMGFLRPQEGNIFIAGKAVDQIDKRHLSKMISYVPQAIHLNTDFSVFDYLSLGRTPHMGRLPKLNDEDIETIQYYSDQLSITSLYKMTFNKLSGGQKQIVAIARSLIQDTPIVILDEPMSALDLEKQADLLEVLHQLVCKGKTVVLTTHNPNHALTVDSDAAFMQEGKIIAYGKSDEIIQDKLISDVYGKNVRLVSSGKRRLISFKEIRE